GGGRRRDRRRPPRLLPALGGLEDRRHRAGGGGKQVIAAIGVDLVALQLGKLAVGGGDDRAALGVHLAGELEGQRRRAGKQVAQHPDDVLVGVVVVVEEDDIPGGEPIRLSGSAGAGVGGRARGGGRGGHGRFYPWGGPGRAAPCELLPGPIHRIRQPSRAARGVDFW